MKILVQVALVKEGRVVVYAARDVHHNEPQAEVLEEGVNLLEGQSHHGRVKGVVVRAMSHLTGAADRSRVEEGPEPLVGLLSVGAVNDDGLIPNLAGLVLGLALCLGEARTKVVNDEVVAAGEGDAEVRRSPLNHLIAGG